MKESLEELKIESLYKFNKFMISSILERLSEKDLVLWAKKNELVLRPNLSKSKIVSNLSAQIEGIGVYRRIAKVDKEMSLTDEITHNGEVTLISQLAYDNPLLTVDKGKMYGIYIVNPDKTINEVSFNNELLFKGWMDHCIDPRNFHQLALELKCDYDNETYAHVCKEWVENYLDSDWTKLHKYLPK